MMLVILIETVMIMIMIKVVVITMMVTTTLLLSFLQFDDEGILNSNLKMFNSVLLGPISVTMVRAIWK